MQSLILYMKRKLHLPVLIILVYNTISGCQAVTSEQNNTTMDSVHTKNPYFSHTDTTKLSLTDEEWKKVLTPEVYAIARGKGTERAFTGKYWDYEGKGTYYCAACGNALFKSDAKF